MSDLVSGEERMQRNSAPISQLSNDSTDQIWHRPAGGFVSGALRRQDDLDVAMLRLHSLSEQSIPI
jgi:hypothetical protein